MFKRYQIWLELTMALYLDYYCFIKTRNAFGFPLLLTCKEMEGSLFEERELSEGPAAEEVENACISLEISQLFYGEGDLSYRTCA